MMNDYSPIKVKPAWVAQKCVNCLCHKTVSYGSKTCPTCEGLGYLKVPVKSDDEDIYEQQR